jgi:hypothetical protein
MEVSAGCYRGVALTTSFLLIVLLVSQGCGAGQSARRNELQTRPVKSPLPAGFPSESCTPGETKRFSFETQRLLKDYTCVKLVGNCHRERYFRRIWNRDLRCEATCKDRANCRLTGLPAVCESSCERTCTRSREEVWSLDRYPGMICWPKEPCPPDGTLIWDPVPCHLHFNPIKCASEVQNHRAWLRDLLHCNCEVSKSWSDCQYWTGPGPHPCGACTTKVDSTIWIATQSPAVQLSAVACSDGRCECLPHRGNCDFDWSNGCEVDLLTDVVNCTGCGQACNPSHVNRATCHDGTCGYDRCIPGFVELDGIRANGCEPSPPAPPHPFEDILRIIDGPSVK